MVASSDLTAPSGSADDAAQNWEAVFGLIWLALATLPAACDLVLPHVGVGVPGSSASLAVDSPSSHTLIAGEPFSLFDSNSSSESGISTNILFLLVVGVSPIGVEPTPSSRLATGISERGSLEVLRDDVTFSLGVSAAAEDEGSPSLLPML
jgi:hypothetical protein